MSQELKSIRNESDYTASGSLTQGRKRMGESGDVRFKAGKFFMGEKEKVLGGLIRNCEETNSWPSGRRTVGENPAPLEKATGQAVSLGRNKKIKETLGEEETTSGIFPMAGW